MFDGFVNPALLAGLALASVPLLIHLLNRQRHRPMEWAAMRFVLAAYRRTRRRARLENLLLLLLRMAAVALLALCVARPFLGARSPLSGLTESRRDLVIALDASASTGYRQDVETVFERIVGRAREVLLTMDSGRGDRVRLVLAGSSPRLLSWRSPEDALSVLGTLMEPTDEALDLVALLGEIATFAEEDAAGSGQSELEVLLLSDLQRADFMPPIDAFARAPLAGAPLAGAPGGAAAGDAAPPAVGDGGGAAPALGTEAPLLVEQLERLSELGVRVLVEDLGPAEQQPDNLSVTLVEPRDERLGPGSSAEIRVVVRNHGTRPADGVRLVLEVDGERRPSRLIDVPAGDEAEAVFAVVFREGGARTLVARVEADRLAIDDERSSIVMVPDTTRVLLVNGAPELELEDDEVGYLAAALEPPLGDDPGAAATAPFDPRVVDRADLSNGSVDLLDWDVIVLANVASLSAQTVERLEQRVAAGGALILTVGDQVDVANWNARLYRPDGSGLLPAELGEVVSIADRTRDYFRVRAFDQTHPVLSFFADERWQPLLTEVPIYEFLSSRPLAPAPPRGEAQDDPTGSRADSDVRGEGVARVLARLGDDDGSPLLIERSYDRGRVFLWLTSIDRAWTRVPESPGTLIPLVHELVRYAARPPAPARNVSVGDQLLAEVSSFPRNLAVIRPDGTRASLEGEPESIGPGSWRLPPFDATDRVGVYTIEVEGDRSLPFAVQLEPGEGDLARIALSDLPAIHPALVPSGPDAASRQDGDQRSPRKGELWRLLAALALAALVAESAWAAWLGWKRRLV